MTVQEYAADAANRIAAADRDAEDSMVAFAAGRFVELWEKRAEELRKRIEADGERIIGNAGSGSG